MNRKCTQPDRTGIFLNNGVLLQDRRLCTAVLLPEAVLRVANQFEAGGAGATKTGVQQLPAIDNIPSSFMIVLYVGCSRFAQSRGRRKPLAPRGRASLREGVQACAGPTMQDKHAQ